METMRRAISPVEFRVQNILSPAVSKLAADIAMTKAFKLPESTMQAIAKATRLADAQRAISQHSIKAFLGAQANLQKPLAAIDSDIFKSTVLAQPHLNAITAELTKNVDFGLSSSFAKIAQQFAANQATWLKNIGPTLEAIQRSFYPSNLRGIEGLRFEEVEQVVMVDGIALYGVPRPSIAEALIRANGASKRREILGRRCKAISADCRAAVGGCRSEAVTSYVSIAIAALDALDEGHTAAAQALTGSLVDSIVNTYFGKARYLYTPNGRTTTNAAYDEFTAHEYIAFAPVWQAWQQFYPDKGDPVPTTFSRNGTAHSVSTKQFTRGNAVQGLMMVCALLVFLDERAVALRL
ncbi:hypothetical protein MELE44368_24180 [Mycolicibacterium elephantis DSM 44368]|uniref:Uncharacterized protein n=3 Tax=Mycolicibacterium elephantis TaxID=81858 RepID=A0A439DQR2_9MYCO|nr:hypothetical protein MELE44368_24180 [Mycolicibacterium elephantis DSM 44368]